MRASFRGSIVALPTPFRDGRIDFGAFRRLIEIQIEAGSHGLVVAGTTGEAATLSDPERLSLVAFAVGVARARIPVLAGIGTSSTHTSCRLAAAAETAGADGVLAVTPPYNRPTQRGLVRHFGALADATELPLVLYNIPSRTGVDLLPETVQEIAQACPSVVAIKEAATSLERVSALVELGTLDVLCGEDRWLADALEAGAVGLIGVVSNLMPLLVVRIIECFAEGGDPDEAPALVEELAPLVHALALETNPAPLKTALVRMGLCEGELRLPLLPLARERAAEVERALIAARLVEA